MQIFSFSNNTTHVFYAFAQIGKLSTIKIDS